MSETIKPMKSQDDGCTLQIDVDPNPNGLPVLFLTFKRGTRTRHIEMFDKWAVELLIQELQRKLAEM